MTHRYWYLTPSADAALDGAIAADHRRTWDPRRDAPSLATLRGKAKRYGGRYRQSMARLLARAGVDVRYVTAPRDTSGGGGRRVALVRMPGESWRATGAPDVLLAKVTAPAESTLWPQLGCS